MMGFIVAVINKRRQDAAPTAVKMLRALAGDADSGIYKLASPTQVKTSKTLESLENEKMKSPVVVGCLCSTRSSVEGCQLTCLGKANLVFDGKLYRSKQKTLGLDLYDAGMHRDAFELAAKLVEESDGDFAFAIAEGDGVVAGRDSLGVRPLYHGADSCSVAVASERKALWSVGICEAESFPPGNVAIFDRERARFRPLRVLAASGTRKMTLYQASMKLQSLLRKSVTRRASDVENVAVAFSGGVDSSLLALLTNESGKKVQLVHASLEGQPEVEHARKVAETLKLPILFSLHGLRDLEEVLPKVMYAVETPDPLQVSIAVPVYWVAEKAHEVGCTVILAGQGADELFGGYKRYADMYLKHGGEEVRKVIAEDTLKMYKLNFERDSKVCGAFDVELRLPFATYELAKFALTLPVELLLERSSETLRKLVLRRVAEDVGLPQFVVERPKKAMQYTTGIIGALIRLAKRKRQTLREYLLQQFIQVFGDMENGM